VFHKRLRLPKVLVDAVPGRREVAERRGRDLDFTHEDASPFLEPSFYNLHPLFGIFGTGRSGTTWLGSIVDSHPEVAYRFEPFHRLRKPLQGIRRDFDQGAGSRTTLDQLYRVLLAADPRVLRAPFYPKDNCPSLGRETTWAMARSWSGLRFLHRRLYTPRFGAPLVFKDVTLESLMVRMVSDGGLRTVYLIRHPCGVVSSLLKGQARGLMPSGRRQYLHVRLREDAPELWERVAHRVGDLSPAEQEALLWRLDVQPALELAITDPRVTLVVYEDLCRRPKEIASEVFEHFDLSLTEQSERAIEQMTSGDEEQRADKWSDRYFTVFRDPAAASSRWRTELAAEDQRAVISLVEDMPAFRRARELGHWD
jgi:hypothetical protein